MDVLTDSFESMVEESVADTSDALAESIGSAMEDAVDASTLDAITESWDAVDDVIESVLE